jgi:hypothetical protein
MDYLNWNDKIAARFFTSEMKDRRVYLYVTNEVIREVKNLLILLRLLRVGPRGFRMAAFVIELDKRLPDGDADN